MLTGNEYCALWKAAGIDTKHAEGQCESDEMRDSPIWRHRQKDDQQCGGATKRNRIAPSHLQWPSHVEAPIIVTRLAQLRHAD